MSFVDEKEIEHTITMSQESSPLFLLPDELIGEIYSYISDPKTVNSLLFVNQKSFAITQDFCCSEAFHVSARIVVATKDPATFFFERPTTKVQIDCADECSHSGPHRMNWLRQVLGAGKHLQKLTLDIHFNRRYVDDDEAAEDNALDAIIGCCSPRLSVKSVALAISNDCGIPKEKIVFLCTSVFQKYSNLSLVSLSSSDRGFGTRTKFDASFKGVLGSILSQVPNMKWLDLNPTGTVEPLHFSSLSNRLVLDFENYCLVLSNAGSLEDGGGITKEGMFIHDIIEELTETDFFRQPETEDRIQMESYHPLRVLGQSNMNEITLNLEHYCGDTFPQNYDQWLDNGGHQDDPLIFLLWVMQNHAQDLMIHFFGAGERNTEQLLTVNMTVHSRRWNRTDLEDCLQTCNDGELDNNFRAARRGLEVDGSQFIRLIPIEIIDDKDLMIENFWTLWKGERKVVFNVHLRVDPSLNLNEDYDYEYYEHDSDDDSDSSWDTVNTKYDKYVRGLGLPENESDWTRKDWHRYHGDDSD